MNLSKDVKISNAITPVVGAANLTTDQGGVALDMADYEGVLMVVTFGTIVSGAACSIKAQQGTTTSPTTDLLGSSQTVADTKSDNTFYIDVYKPAKRYVRLFVARATQNIPIAAAHYIQYGPRVKPVTHGSAVAGETHISPIEGTA